MCIIVEDICVSYNERLQICFVFNKVEKIKKHANIYTDLCF